MNKKITLSIVASALVIGGLAWNASQPEKAYSPRQAKEQSVEGYANYLQSIRANQITGVISPQDVAAARAQVRLQHGLKNKVEFPMKWEFAGPDNIAGRTKSLVIDKDNPNIMYTGGVSGGIFRSTNRGGSWYPLTLEQDFFGISCMAQTSDGAIFAGTGERGINVNNSGGQETFTPGFDGSGIYMSTDGENFDHLSNTSGFGNINCLKAHPTGGILVGSQSGLRFSDDQGATWTLIRAGNCKDIAVNDAGEAIVYITNTIYRVSDVKSSSEYTTSNRIVIGQFIRAAAAWSKTDQDYCYIVAAGTVSTNIAPINNQGLVGLWRSTDGGITWSEEVNEASTYFAPFSNLGNNTQGNWDMAIAVHPENRDRVFIGGVHFAEWTLEAGPEIVGSTFGAVNNPFVIHADKHHITFDESGSYPVMYICTDGGIFKTTNEEMTNYAEVNTGFTTTQFYGIDAGRNGRIIGGTQDQSTILITNQSFPRKKGIEVLSGDGFQAQVSRYNPNVMFGESYNGLMRRSVAGGIEMATIWDNRIRQAFVSPNQPNTTFNTPLELWEEPRFVDSALLYNTTKLDWDTVMKSRLFMPMANGVYMCNNAIGEAFNPDDPSNDRIRWFRVSTVVSSGQSNEVSQLATSHDGDHLFIGTNSGRIYRTSGLNAAAFDTTTSPVYSDIPSGITTTDIRGNLSISGRDFTSIAVDENDANHVVITLGNYGNSSFIYETLNALDDNPTWRSLQSNLPSAPVYHAVIDPDNSDVIIVGTEFGIWATSNASSSNPTWVEAMDGSDVNKPFPYVPVLSLTQVRPRPDLSTVVYAGTHGMGIYKSGNLALSVKEDKPVVAERNIVAYPNPANNFVNVRSDIKGSYKLNVYSLNGEVVLDQQGTSNGTIKVNTSTLRSGNYFVEVVGDNNKAVAKIIVQH